MSRLFSLEHLFEDPHISRLKTAKALQGREADTEANREEGRGLVQLDPDHPGFRDAEYRKRRNTIAHLAHLYRSGQPVPDAPYSANEDQLWAWICRNLAIKHNRYACRAYLETWEALDLPQDRIPQLQEVSAKIEPLTGFRLEPVAGLIEAHDFMKALSKRVFLATQYIRHYSCPAYTPEPDVVHEIIGHSGQLAHPVFAELNQRFGQLVLTLSDPKQIEQLARVYWFTIEFGVLMEQNKVKAYGAGLLSSFGELDNICKAEIRPFSISAIESQEFDVTNFQAVLYCAQDIKQVIRELDAYLG